MNGKSRTTTCIKSVFLLFYLCLSLGAVSGESKSRKIVIFQDWFSGEAAQDYLLSKSGALKHKSLKLINGAAVDISSQMEKALKEKRRSSGSMMT